MTVEECLGPGVTMSPEIAKALAKSGGPKGPDPDAAWNRCTCEASRRIQLLEVTEITALSPEAA